MVVREEVPEEGLFDKEPDTLPPYTQNSIAPPSVPGDPIEAGVFNASNWAEDIVLVRNRGLEVDDDMDHPLIIFLWLTLLLLTHCLRDRHEGGMALIAVLW